MKKMIDNFKGDFFSKGDNVLVALSGGVDSSVLLSNLISLSCQIGFNLAVCHLNHNLRGDESKRDFDFARNLAKENSLKFYAKTFTKEELSSIDGESLQAGLRSIRYDFFLESAGKFKATKIALGHNSDDVVETFLMRAIKGAGLKGLTSIKGERDVFVRPLLNVSRIEIEKYAKANKIKFVEDSSNKVDKYFRNSVRNNLIPYVEKKYNKSFKQSILRTVSNLSVDDDFIGKEVLKLFNKSVVKVKPSKFIFNRKKILNAHKALQLRLLFNMLNKLDSSGDYLSVHGSSFLELIKSSAGSKQIILPRGITVVRAYDEIIFSKSLNARVLKPHKIDLSEDGSSSYDFFDYGCAIEFSLLKTVPKSFKNVPENISYFDFDKLGVKLLLRTPKEGDTIRPLGMTGVKKLKNIFIDEKVPSAERKSYPIIAKGTKVISIPNICQSDEFKVTADTKRCIKMTLNYLD